jgi:hypothetical protein
MIDQERQIRYFLAGNDGKFLTMGAFRFLGRSVLNLTNQMAIKVDEDVSAITLCVYAGVFGRLTPLVVDLPRNQEPLNIVVLPISSPGENSAVPSVVCMSNVCRSYYHIDDGSSYAHIFSTLLGNLLTILCLMKWQLCSVSKNLKPVVDKHNQFKIFSCFQ